MFKFGIKNKFEIWVDYYFIKYKDNEDFIQVYEKYKYWANVYFWVNQKNIFAYQDSDPNATYTFDLNVLIRFFCNNLFFLITDDPFPTKTRSNTGINMMEEIKLVPGDDSILSKWDELDWDNIDMSTRNEIDYWNIRHGLLGNSDGSFLPNAFIRKINNEIEISWNNKYPFASTRGEFYSLHKHGIEFIALRSFRDTIVMFCMDFINKFKNVNPHLVLEYKENLQRAIKIDLE